MFITKYTDNPGSDEELIPCSGTYDDGFEEEYETHVRSLDRFIFLVDMFRIVKSCTSDLLNLKGGGDVPFWLINKTLINYLNAVYSYKEYINSYEPPLKKITDGYYYNRKWYRFVCDYRNRVIHQSTIIKDRSTKTGDIYIDLDEMVLAQNEIIAELLSDPNSSESSIKNAKRFLKEIQSLLPEQPVGTYNRKKLQSMKRIAQDADSEITLMNNEILLHAYRNSVLPHLRWLLSVSHKENDRYWYTFIVNEDWGHLPEKSDVACFEPNYSVELFYQYLLRALGNESPVCKAIKNILEADGYTYVYEQACSLNEFFEREGN